MPGLHLGLGLGLQRQVKPRGGGPPPVSDPHWGNVVLLCGFDGADGATSASDESSKGHALTFNGNAQLDTAQSKFGGSSLLLDGTGDFVSSADSADWDFGAGQFTIEAFVRLSVAESEWTIVSQWANGSNAAWALFQTGATFYFRFVDSGGVTRDTAASFPVFGSDANKWIHFAVDRDATGKVRLYIDGIKHASNTFAQTVRGSTNPLRIGGTQDFPTLDFPGWIDELRITKGVARYASDAGFTVPTAAFPRG